MSNDKSRPASGVPPLQPTDQTAFREQFLIEEQKQRRAEIERLLKTHEADQRYAILASGAAWTWLATHVNSLPGYQTAFLGWILSIPAILVGFFAWRWSAVHRSVQSAAKYTLRLEWLARLPFGFGWENFLHTEESEDGKFHEENGSKPWILHQIGVPGRHRSTMWRLSLFFWIGLFAADVGGCVGFHSYVKEAQQDAAK
jgi:hypothetical protein